VSVELYLSAVQFWAVTAPAATKLDPSVIVAIIALISSVGGIIIANRYTSRNARDAAAKSVIVEQGKLDEQRRQSLMDNMQEEITRLTDMRRKDREDFEAELAKTNARLTTISTEHDQYRRERTFLQQQVDTLVMWSRAVVRVMRTAGVQYPPPPPGVDTDPDGFPPIRARH
jgi:spore coat protein CotF